MGSGWWLALGSAAGVVCGQPVVFSSVKAALPATRHMHLRSTDSGPLPCVSPPSPAVLRTVAGVLHLGNVSFTNNAADEAAVADGASLAALETAARLLGVSDVGLEAALTTRAIDARGERIVKRLDDGGWVGGWVGWLGGVGWLAGWTVAGLGEWVAGRTGAHLHWFTRTRFCECHLSHATCPPCCSCCAGEPRRAGQDAVCPPL